MQSLDWWAIACDQEGAIITTQPALVSSLSMNFCFCSVQISKSAQIWSSFSCGIYKWTTCNRISGWIFISMLLNVQNWKRRPFCSYTVSWWEGQTANSTRQFWDGYICPRPISHLSLYHAWQDLQKIRYGDVSLILLASIFHNSVHHRTPFFLFPYYLVKSGLSKAVVVTLAISWQVFWSQIEFLSIVLRSTCSPTGKFKSMLSCNVGL